MMESENQIVLQGRSDGIIILSLNRPDRRNAMSGALVAALLEILDALADDPRCRAIILTGSDTGFCAGSDLHELASLSPADRSQFETESGTLARRIAATPIPVIAAVERFAIGGGLTLAASCDIVISQSTAKWSLPEVPIGLFPAWGLWAVEARTGRTNARRLSWGIDTLDGTEAHRLGLVDFIDEHPFSKAAEIAKSLAALPSEQVRQVKSYFARTGDGETDDRDANHLFMQAAKSDSAVKTFQLYGSKP